MSWWPPPRRLLALEGVINQEQDLTGDISILLSVLGIKEYCTQFTVHCTVYTLQCTLYTVQCLMISLPIPTDQVFYMTPFTLASKKVLSLQGNIKIHSIIPESLTCPSNLSF